MHHADSHKIVRDYSYVELQARTSFVGLQLVGRKPRQEGVAGVGLGLLLSVAR